VSSGIEGLGDNVQLKIDIYTDTHGSEEKIEGVSDALGSTKKDVELSAQDWRKLASGMRDAGYQYQVQSAPIRSMSWDLMLTGRSFSIMNAALLGSNSQLKQMIGLLYTVAAALRLSVMKDDFTRAKIEMDYKNKFLNEAKNNVVASAGDSSNSGPYNLSNLIKPSSDEGQTAINLSNLVKPIEKVKTVRTPPTRNPNFAKLVDDAPLYMTGQSSKKNMPSVASNVAGLGVGAATTAGTAAFLGPFAPLIGGLLGSAASSMIGFAQGGVVQKEGPVYAHRGEAFVKERDFHAVNNILKNFSQPMKSGISSPQSSVSTPRNSQVINNGSSDDVHNFTTINMTTGPIGSNVDVKNMLKQMAQAQTTESRRRTGQ
jgi:hypothetical protein